MVYQVFLKSPQYSLRSTWLPCDFCSGHPRDGRSPSWWRGMVWSCEDHLEVVQRMVDLREAASGLPRA